MNLSPPSLSLPNLCHASLFSTPCVPESPRLSPIQSSRQAPGMSNTIIMPSTRNVNTREGEEEEEEEEESAHGRYRSLLPRPHPHLSGAPHTSLHPSADGSNAGVNNSDQVARGGGEAKGELLPTAKVFAIWVLCPNLQGTPGNDRSRPGPCHYVFPKGTRLKKQHPKASFLLTIASQTQGHSALCSCKKQFPNYQAEPSISQTRHRHTHHRSIPSSSRVHYRSWGFKKRSRRAQRDLITPEAVTKQSSSACIFSETPRAHKSQKLPKQQSCPDPQQRF